MEHQALKDMGHLALKDMGHLALKDMVHLALKVDLMIQISMRVIIPLIKQLLSTIHNHLSHSSITSTTHKDLMPIHKHNTSVGPKVMVAPKVMAPKVMAPKVMGLKVMVRPRAIIYQTLEHFM